MLYEISNNLETSLVIEDIGIFLQARGGSDSSSIITQNMYDSSSDLQKMIKLKRIRVSSRPVPTSKKSFPIWPVSALNIKAPNVTPTLPINTPVSPPPVQDISSLKSSVSHLDGVMSEILSLLRSGSIPSVSSDHFRLKESRNSISSDPIFIPNKIVPDAEAKISVVTSESDNAGFDKSREALSKLRKKK